MPQLLIGTFTMFNRESPYLIAAPHGEYDENTGELVYDFCEQVRWDCLIAEGFRDEKAMINVNRPTEGARLSETRFSESAAVVYAKYVHRIRRLSPKVLFYVEIHGHDHSGLTNTVDIATVGISHSQAVFIHDTLTQAFEEQGLSALDVRLDALEPIHYNATHARRFGVLSFISPALHIELPHSTRHEHRARVVNALGKALPRVARDAFPFQQLEPR